MELEDFEETRNDQDHVDNNNNNNNDNAVEEGQDVDAEEADLMEGLTSEDRQKLKSAINDDDDDGEEESLGSDFEELTERPDKGPAATAAAAVSRKSVKRAAGSRHNGGGGGDDEDVDVDVDEDEDEDEDEEDRPEADESANLPCVVLEFGTQFYVLFGDSEGIESEDILFHKERSVFVATISEFMKSLKAVFEITTDITIEFPQLELSFPQDLSHAKVHNLGLDFS
jgi:hypothetical protein